VAKSQQKSDQSGALPPVYLPAEVAKALHCSEWWVKEQARKGRIPFSRVGGGYRFTAEHVEEILRRFEQRPVESDSSIRDAVAPARQQSHPSEAAAVQLAARPPRRTRHNQQQSAAA